MTTSSAKHGFAGRIASMFIDSKLTPIVVAASLLLGFFAVLMLPREEEPQIKVPMIDVMVAMPGASAHEIENPESSVSAQPDTGHLLNKPAGK